MIILQIPVQSSFLLMTAAATLKRRGLKRYVAISNDVYYLDHAYQGTNTRSHIQ